MVYVIIRVNGYFHSFFLKKNTKKWKFKICNNYSIVKVKGFETSVLISKSGNCKSDFISRKNNINFRMKRTEMTLLFGWWIVIISKIVKFLKYHIIYSNNTSRSDSFILNHLLWLSKQAIKKFWSHDTIIHKISRICLIYKQVLFFTSPFCPYPHIYLVPPSTAIIYEIIISAVTRKCVWSLFVFQIFPNDIWCVCF